MFTQLPEEKKDLIKPPLPEKAAEQFCALVLF